MSRSTPESTLADGDLVIEAPTAEAALELVAERLGTRARISGVERVRRGGIGGFFARELVQVTATAAGGTDGDGADRDLVAGPPRAPHGPPDDATDAVVDGLLAQVDAVGEPTSFGQLLSRHLAEPDPDADPTVDPDIDALPARSAPDRPPSATPPPEPGPAPVTPPPEPGPAPLAPPPEPGPAPVAPPAPPAAPSPVPAAPRPPRSVLPQRADPGMPEWSLANLRRIGLTGVVHRGDVEGLEPRDDSGWTHALATRLAPLCGPLPRGPVAIVGPSANRLASVTGLPRCEAGADRTPESFVAVLGDSDDERRWLASVRRGRTLHLVVGDRRWRRLLFDEPTVLSWTAGELCEAISLAAALDLTLGYAIPDIGTAVRATAVDLAVAVRGLLPTATHRGL